MLDQYPRLLHFTTKHRIYAWLHTDENTSATAEHQGNEKVTSMLDFTISRGRAGKKNETMI